MPAATVIRVQLERLTGSGYRHQQPDVYRVGRVGDRSPGTAHCVAHRIGGNGRLRWSQAPCSASINQRMAEAGTPPHDHRALYRAEAVYKSCSQSLAWRNGLEIMAQFTDDSVTGKLPVHARAKWEATDSAQVSRAQNRPKGQN